MRWILDQAGGTILNFGEFSGFVAQMRAAVIHHRPWMLNQAAKFSTAGCDSPFCHTDAVPFREVAETDPFRVLGTRGASTVT